MENLSNWQIKKSTRANKKYMARYNNGPWLHFGDTRYEQYKDSTPLKLYKNLDHGDKKRRELYKLRHSKDINVIGTSGWLADKFLW